LSGSLLTARQVARQLGVPTSWVYEQSRRGVIPSVSLGRYRRYRAEAIADWVQGLEGRGVRDRRGSGEPREDRASKGASEKQDLEPGAA
jgi:excisionase family DNA binding protein